MLFPTLFLLAGMAAGPSAAAAKADSTARPLGTIPPGITDGYASTVSGEVFGYHSAHPTERSSLLVRSLDSTNAAVWMTAPVAKSSGTLRHVAFLAAMDVTDPGQSAVHFYVTVNGRHRFVLPQPSTTARTWRVEGPSGIGLDFRRLLVDKFGDVHGVFSLTVPEDIAPVGEPLTLQVHGESVDRRSWFILYTVSMQPTVSAHAEQMLAREAGRLMQTVRLDAWNPFESTTISVAVDGERRLTTDLESGAVTTRVGVPAVERPTTVSITVTAGDTRADFDAVPLLPVAPREVHLIPHSHLDIGYTNVHELVMQKQWRGIDSALAYVDRTRSRPAGSRFKWNIEGLWPLEEYLATRPPADTTRLLSAARRGDIAISGLYANLMTGLAGSEELIHLLDYAQRLREDRGIPITTAMTSDVPGFTWGMVPALAKQGVRYLSSGPNYMPGPGQDGDRIGNTLSAWGDRPFWWIGPSGRDSVLVMTAGRGYSWMGGWPRGHLALEDAWLMSEYMDELRDEDYPYEIVQVRYAIGGDNGFPDSNLPDEVRAWNERFVSPRLVISTLPEMFEAFEKRYGDRLPRIRADLTGYWEDGAVSTAREVVMNRASAARLVQAEALSSIRGLDLADTDREAAWRQVLLWDEHTWGADVSVSEPDSPETLAQWRQKQRFALQADSLSRALLVRAGRPTGTPVYGREIDIWNTRAYVRSGVTLIPDSLSLAGDRVTGEDGTAYPSQRLFDGSLAVRIPLRPLGATRVTVGPGDPTLPPEPTHAAGDSLWNGLVSVRIDAHTGALKGVSWRGMELVDTPRGGWNRYLYLLGRDTTLVQDASGSRIRVMDDGPLVATLRVTSSAPGVVSLVRDVTLHAGSDAVTIVTRLDKSGVRDKESVHLSFPLAIPDGTVRMEQGLAVVRPDVDQADGANRNLYPVQRWIDASNDSFGVTVATSDLGLWQLNGLTAESFMQPDGRQEWMHRSLPGTELVAYAMNNYWHTNFKADQPGQVTFRVTLRLHGPFDPAAATRVGLDAAEPPIVLPAEPGPVRPSLFTLDHPGAVIGGMSPSADGRADLVRLWNPGDQPVHVGFRFDPGSAREIRMSSPAGESGPLAPAKIEIPALGSVTVRIER